MGFFEWVSKWGSGAATAVPVQEAYAPYEYDYEDTDLNLPDSQNAQNWRRLSQAASDLPQQTTERMQNIALGLSDRNPLGKAVGDLLTAFVVGEGFKVQSKDKEVQTILDRFWEDSLNDLEERAEDFTREQSIYGEQCLLAFVNDRSGRVALVSSDPRSIVQVVKHPRNTDQDFAVCLGGGRLANDERWIKIIAEDQRPDSETFGKLIGAEPGETFRLGDETKRFYDPEMPAEDTSRLVGCFFAPINRPRAATRGRSDLLAITDFVDLYDRLLFDEAERMSFLRAFVWDVTVQGASKADLDARAQKEPVPKPGSVKFHNENETWEARSPSLGSQDSATIADLILSVVATAVGVPKTWLNGVIDTNRATASEMGEPALKRLSKRQRRVVKTFRQISRFALDQAEMAGALKPSGDARHDFTVNVPEMSTKDLQKAASAFQTTMQALGMADLSNWVDDGTAQKAVVLMAEQLGLKVDLEEMQAAITAQQAQDAQNDIYQYPPYLGQGGRPGPEPLAAAMDQRLGRQPATNGRTNGAAPRSG